jgi:hypothetical protein
VVLNKKAPEKANKSLADGVNVLNPHSTRAAPPQTPSASNRAIHSKVNAFTGLVLGINAGKRVRAISGFAAEAQNAE